MSISYKEPQNYFNTYEYTYIDFSNNKLMLERMSDLIHMECLEFNSSQFVDLEDFISKYKKAHLVIKNFEDIIVNLPFDLLMDFHIPTEKENKIFLTIDFKMFIPDFILVGMMYSKINLIITNVDSDNTNTYLTRLLVKKIYVKNEFRKSLATDAFRSCIQTIDKIDKISNIYDEDTTYKYLLSNNKNYKGFFMKTSNIKNITEIKINYKNLQTNEENNLSLDLYLIDAKCIKINDFLLYFPYKELNYNVISYDDLNYYDLTKTNTNDYEKTLILKFNERNKIDIVVYDLCVDEYLTYSGMFAKTKSDVSNEIFLNLDKLNSFEMKC